MMRADAEANRERLLDAAAEIFAEHGVDATLSLVTDLAGVGPGTLYRHFADRDALVLGLAARIKVRYDAIVTDAAAAPSGWDAIVTYINGMCAMYVDMPWLVAVRTRARQLGPTDARYEIAAAAVAERAWAEGMLRRDATLTDLTMVPSLLAGLVDLPEPMRSVVIARQRDIILDGLRAEGRPRPPLGSIPLDAETLRRHVNRDPAVPIPDEARPS